MSTNTIKQTRKEIAYNSFIDEQITNTVSVPYNTWTKLGTFTLDPGTWFINVNTTFSGDTTGRRGCYVASEGTALPTTRPGMYSGIQIQPCPTDRTYLEYNFMTQQGSQTVFYVAVFQNRSAGTALNNNGCYIQAIRLA